MRRAWLIALALLTPLVVGLSEPAASTAEGQSAGPPDTFVTDWDGIGTQAFSAAALSPAEGHTIFAYVAIAVYDSVIAVKGGYEPFAVDVDAPAGASAEAAVAAAAHRILVHYLPAQAATILDPAYTASLAAIPDGQAKTDGIAIGENVAGLAHRPASRRWLPSAGSRRTSRRTHRFPACGSRRHPRHRPASTSASMQPFSLDSADQFRPGGPPPLDSRKWAREYNEVKEIGSSTSTTRTAEQTLAARFWAEAPVQQARGSFRKFVLDHQLDIVRAARFMAMISVTYADANIACFDAKYHFAFWRPITAIRAGDTDGNAATVGDSAWSPLLAATPNHPEYPSAHSCLTPAAGRVIARFLGTKQIDFTVPSLTGLGDRHFAYVRDLEYDVGNARIWGGIHFRSAVDDGIMIAKKVANQVLDYHFHRSDD